MDPSALSAGRAVFTLDLAPAAAGAGAAGALAGAKAALARRLLRWSPDLGGVLLGIKDERLVGGLAPIGEVFPLVRVQVAAHVTVFRPRPGMALSGVINKVGADHVGILTLGAINAAVGADRVRAAFARPAGRVSSASSTPASPAGGGTTAAWTHRADAGHVLAVGAPVVYECVRVRADGGGFASVVGSLEGAHTGVLGRVPPPPRWVAPAAMAAAAAAAPAAEEGGGGEEAEGGTSLPTSKEGKKRKGKGAGGVKAGRVEKVVKVKKVKPGGSGGGGRKAKG